MATKDYEYLREFTYTDRQREILDAVRDSDTIADAALALSISERNTHAVLSRLQRKAASAGVSPDHGLTKGLPAGQQLKGVSELVGADGETRLMWIKSNADAQARAEAMQEFVAELCEQVVPRAPMKAPKYTESDILAGYPIGDHHFGMYAYAAETGADYDIKIAKQALEAAVDYLVASAPPADSALLCNLGDFLHMDNRTNMTPASGHILDTDTRYSKVIKVAAFGLAHAVNRLLEKHRTVRVVNVPGNHDPDSASWLALVMQAWFRDEPRVEVDTSPAMYLFHQFGKNMICMTHGHTVKLPDLPQVMASLQPTMWGDTTYRVGWTGHVHHTQRMMAKENRGAIAESFGVLPPNDAYSASKGYASQREMHCITFKKSGGVLCRTTYNADLP